MLQAESKRPQKLPGLSDETLNDVLAFLVVVVGIFLTLALVSENDGHNLIGRLGSLVYQVLSFVLGKYVAYLVPTIVFLLAYGMWTHRRLQNHTRRVCGVFLAALSFCSLFAMSYAETDLSTQEGFRVGGALGNFMMHKKCLYLKGYLGPAGSYLFFFALLLIATMLITDTQLRSVLVRGWALLHEIRPGERLGKLLDAKDAWLERRRGSEAVASGVLGGQEPVQTPPMATRRFDPVMPGGAVPRVATPVEVASPVPVAEVPPQPAPASRTPIRFVASKIASLRDDLQSAVFDALETKKAFARRQASAENQPAGGDPGPLLEAEDLVSMAEGNGAQQEDLPLFNDHPYELPSLDLLNPPPQTENKMSKEEMVDISGQLEKTLQEFGISVQVVQVTQGPTVTRFELQPAPGVKVARIASLENDIAMCMKAESVRIMAPIPGRGTVGIEVPNKKPTPVVLRELLATETFANHRSPLAFALGKTISGEPYICDLAAMPHLLIAGTTGSGKSVCLNSVICSMLFRMPPEQVKMVMIDPKRVELNVYQAIPHLLAPVVCEPRKASAALQWAIEQMEDRYKKLASLGVRNIDGYNAIVLSKEPHPKAIGRKLEYMPHIVIVVDELADLMIIARNEVEDSIIRLAQMSRAVGMHLIIATQRPSVNVITGIIKANFPSRVAFQVSSKVDSRTILDTNGAEALLGRGDMLFSKGGSPKPIRLQGCYVSDQEVERVADYVRAQQKACYLKQDFVDQREAEAAHAAQAAAGYRPQLDGIDADDSAVMQAEGEEDYDYSYRQERADGLDPVAVARGKAGNGKPSLPAEDGEAIDEELFRQAVKLILTHKKASVSLLQRKLKIGFARAGRLMDMIEEEGIVGPNVGSKVREILVDPDEYLQQVEEQEEEQF